VKGEARGSPAVLRNASKYERIARAGATSENAGKEKFNFREPHYTGTS
jgi:hypothetical protein